MKAIYFYNTIFQRCTPWLSAIAVKIILFQQWRKEGILTCMTHCNGTALWHNVGKDVLLSPDSNF